ncbi:MAG TPA: hypothetical protein ENK48_01940 [Gammaproteobacteria bacterium]|nr:hypothetical protein [Gammaproteobacteria bacterium]
MGNTFNLEELLEGFKQQADELRLQMHLARAEVRDEWQSLEKKLEELRSKAEVVRKEAGEASEDVLEAARLMAEEIKRGFDRIRKAL